MDISDLKEFISLSRHCNFQEAAEECFMSQSTLSKHIKRLEKEIGYNLFTRNSSKVKLSEYGRLLLPYAQKIVAMDEECRKALHDYEKKQHETLSIGSTPVMVPYEITTILSNFRRDNPSSFVNIIEGETQELLELLNQKKIRLAFIVTSVLEESRPELNILEQEFIKVPYEEDELAIVLPLGHKFSLKSSLALSSVQDEPFIFWPAGTAMYDRCHDACSYYHFSPNIVLSAPRGQSIVDMVSQNMGISIMLRKQALCTGNTGIVTVPIEPRIPVHISLIYSKQAELTDMEARFISSIKEHATIQNIKENEH